MTITRSVSRFAIAIALAMVCSAQTQERAAAKVETSWTPARLPDGQPDLGGFWNAEIGGTYSLVNPRRGGGRQQELLRQRQGLEPIRKPSRVVDPPDGQIPYQPWARAKQKELEAHADILTKPEYVDPQARCMGHGPVRSNFWTTVHFRQYPGYVVILHDQNHTFRVIPLDGRPHIGNDIKLWMGDSRGRWQGNTLVADVTSNNSKSRLTNEGDFASDKVHYVERYTLLDPKTMLYEVTVTDPTVYTRPWKISARFVRANADDPAFELWENACHEGERNADELITDAH